MSAFVFKPIEWAFFVYFVGLQATYAVLALVTIPELVRHAAARRLDGLPERYSEYEIPISVIVPCWNEESTVLTSVSALLGLRYASYEVVVVDDGSTDSTLARLIEAFELKEVPPAPAGPVPHAPVRGEFQSARHANLRVVSKVNGGGKADAANAGIDAARHPLVCCVDGDSILDPDALRRAAEPFALDPRTVAVGGAIRIANGCRVEGGRLVEAHLPRRQLARFQVIEYLRAFLIGRIGWARLNSLLIVSGAFGLFRRDVLLEVGGYRTDVLGEDMELITRMHEHLRANGADYRIGFIRDPVCWTEVPEDLVSLGRQRIRWQRGLAESLWLNRRLALSGRGGPAGWVAFPYYVVFEGLAPVVELAGIVILIVAAAIGILSVMSLVACLAIVLGAGLAFSATAVLLEQLSSPVYSGRRQLLVLVGTAIAENFGYRQLTAVWRVVGLWHFLFGRPSEWKPMRRDGSWQEALVRPG